MTNERKLEIISVIIGTVTGVLMIFWPVIAGAMMLFAALVFFFMTHAGAVLQEKIICLMDPRSFMVELIDWRATHRRTARVKKLPSGRLWCVSPPRDFDDSWLDITLNDDGTITSEDQPIYYFWIPLARNRRVLHLMTKDVPDFDLISRMPAVQRIDAMEKARKQAQSTS